MLMERYKSAEEYLKQIIRIAIDLKARIEKGDYDEAITFLQLIVKIDADLYSKIEEETRSKALMEQSLVIRALTEEALKEARNNQFEKVKQVIDKIATAGEKYLESEEKFVGYTIEEHQFGSWERQARFLSDIIEGITVQQAIDMLTIAYEEKLDIVIGGSSLKNNRIGNDLDIGFKVNPLWKNQIPQSEVRAIVTRVVNKMNKRCFHWYQRVMGNALIPHKWIHDQSALQGIPDIETVEEFFMRRGFREEPRMVMKHGKPFGPSGYLILRRDGKVTLVTPIIKIGRVGEPKFW